MEAAQLLYADGSGRYNHLHFGPINQDRMYGSVGENSNASTPLFVAVVKCKSKKPAINREFTNTQKKKQKKKTDQDHQNVYKTQM